MAAILFLPWIFAVSFFHAIAFPYSQRINQARGRLQGYFKVPSCFLHGFCGVKTDSLQSNLLYDNLTLQQTILKLSCQIPVQLTN